MRELPPVLRGLFARAGAARRTAEALETGDQAAAPLFVEVEDLELVSSRGLETLLAVPDGSEMLARLLGGEKRKEENLLPSAAKGSGGAFHRVGQEGGIARGGANPGPGPKAPGAVVPPPLGGRAVGSGGGQEGGSSGRGRPARESSPPGPLSHLPPFPPPGEGEKGEERRGVSFSSPDRVAESSPRPHPDAATVLRLLGVERVSPDGAAPTSVLPLSQPAPEALKSGRAEAGFSSWRRRAQGTAARTSRSFSPSPGGGVGGRWERGPGGEDSRAAVPAGDTRSARRVVFSSPSPGEGPTAAAGDTPVIIAPDPRVAALLAGGAGEGFGTAPTSVLPLSQPTPSQGEEAPAPALRSAAVREPVSPSPGRGGRGWERGPGGEGPALPVSGGLRALAALAGYGDEPTPEAEASPASSPAPSPSSAPLLAEPLADDLAERLERLLRREARRHGIEVES